MKAGIFKDTGNGQIGQIAFVVSEGFNWTNGRVYDAASNEEIGYIALGSQDHTVVNIYKNTGEASSRAKLFGSGFIRDIVGSAVKPGLIFRGTTQVGHIDDDGKVYREGDNKVLGYVEGVRVGNEETNYMSLVLKGGAALVTLLS